MKILNEALASLLLFACVAALVYIAAFVLPSMQPSVNVHEYKYVLAVDSAGHLTEEARCQADSLIAAVKHHERSINEHYDYVLQQKEDTQTLYTAIGAILSVVVAVFGFFGYKNYKSIEEKAIATANDQVDDKMHEVAHDQEKAMKKLHEECLAQIGREITRQFVDFKDKTLGDAIARRLKDEYMAKINSQLDEVDVQKQRLDELEHDVQLLSTRFYNMESTYRKTIRPKKKSTPSDEHVNGESDDLADMINNHGKDNNDE